MTARKKPTVVEVSVTIENLEGGINPVVAEKQPHSDADAAAGLEAAAQRIGAVNPAAGEILHRIAVSRTHKVQTAADRRNTLNRLAGWPAPKVKKD